MYPFLRTLYEANMRSFHEEEPECKQRESYQRRDPSVIDLAYDEESGTYRMEV